MIITFAVVAVLFVIVGYVIGSQEQPLFAMNLEVQAFPAKVGKHAKKTVFMHSLPKK